MKLSNELRDYLMLLTKLHLRPIALAKKNKGTPILKAHEALIDKALEGQNTKACIMQSLLHTGERLGRLMGVTEKELDPNSPSDSNISI